MQWWFLIRGEEADLLVLDQEWEAVHKQHGSWSAVIDQLHKTVMKKILLFRPQLNKIYPMRGNHLTKQLYITYFNARIYVLK